MLEANMKLNTKYFLPFALLMCTVTAFGQEAPEFSSADKNQDGMLGHQEAAEALPEVKITDDNGDGVVNYAEAEKSVEGLNLPDLTETSDETLAPVGRSEYLMIVQIIEANNTDA